MTPNLSPQSCFDAHMEFSEIRVVFRVVNARQTTLQSGRKDHHCLAFFRVHLLSGRSIIQIRIDNVLSQECPQVWTCFSLVNGLKQQDE